MAQPNLSLNGISGTLWEIRRQENVHPYLGLRQAILIINTQEKSLKEGYLSKKRIEFKLKQQQQQLASSFGDERDIAEAEIDILEYDLQSFDQLILDTETELKVAREEKQRIESLYPEMTTETYEGLQHKYASEAFQRKLAKAIVVSAYSSQKMISEGAAEVIYDSACLPENDRIRFEMDVISQLTRLLPPENPEKTDRFLEPTNGGTDGATATRN